jgi:hypothetical protein
MRLKRILLFLFLTSSLAAVQKTGFSPGGEDSSLILKSPEGQINWSTGEILVTGVSEIPEVIKDPNDYRFKAGDPSQPRNAPQARILARDRAKERALIQASKLILSLRIDSKTLLSDYMKNEIINRKVHSFINDPLRVRSVEYSSNRCKVTLEYALFGQKSLIGLNTETEFRDNFINTSYEKYPAAFQTNRMYWEGLVVSAPYLHPALALNPKIYSENGRLVYDGSYAYGEDAAGTGLVLYAQRPFGLVKPVNVRFFHSRAVNTAGYGSCDLVISDEDADAILSSPKTLENLRKCKVVILVPEQRK